MDTSQPRRKKGVESFHVNLLGMPISIYFSVNEDERVGGYPGFPRNKTCSKRIPSGKGGGGGKKKKIQPS
jgi:hypothetical protein